jgi:hypothetical protein
MKDLAEILFLCCLGLILIAIILLIVSLPFALLGWILLAFVNLFHVTAAITYFNCVIAGAGSLVVVGLLGAIAK